MQCRLIAQYCLHNSQPNDFQHPSSRAIRTRGSVNKATSLRSVTLIIERDYFEWRSFYDSYWTYLCWSRFEIIVRSTVNGQQWEIKVGCMGGLWSIEVIRRDQFIIYTFFVVRSKALQMSYHLNKKLKPDYWQGWKYSSMDRLSITWPVSIHQHVPHAIRNHIPNVTCEQLSAMRGELPALSTHECWQRRWDPSPRPRAPQSYTEAMLLPQ